VPDEDKWPIGRSGYQRGLGRHAQRAHLAPRTPDPGVSGDSDVPSVSGVGLLDDQRSGGSGGRLSRCNDHSGSEWHLSASAQGVSPP